MIKPARDELIRQAAQGEVLHNDDTGMRVLKLEREPGDKRTGVFTSGIVSTAAGRKIALYFTGRQHAGENIADVLKQRARGVRRGDPDVRCVVVERAEAAGRGGVAGGALPRPRTTADCRSGAELSRRVPARAGKSGRGLPATMRRARDAGMTAEERLRFHQQHSKPIMDALHDWLEAQFAERKVEPNSSLGKAITYLLRHWKALTLFLRQAGAPLDNNLCERALKRAVLHRKNALFYRTLNGAQVGDLFMSLIHTCELCGANSFDYLTELQRHAQELAANPASWMPWNYRETLAQRWSMMSLAWPKRIDCGHGWVTLRNAHKTGFSKGKIR